MGNTDTKLSYRANILELTGRNQPIESNDEEFWSQFWHENYIETIQDAFTLLSAQDIRTLRDESPSNLATFCYKAVEQMVRVTDTLCNTTSQQKTVLTCVSLITRILPYTFEDADWRRFFWSNLPSPSNSYTSIDNERLFHNSSKVQPRLSRSNSIVPQDDISELMSDVPLAQSLLLSLTDLLFCPDFTVAPLDVKGSKFGAPDTPPDDLRTIDSCEYIWEAGVGCSVPSPSSAVYDHNRTELLRLLLTCFSESMYCSTVEVGRQPNQWIEFFTSSENRHSLPLFTSLLNTVFAYNPTSMLPFNHLLFSDSKEPLVEVALQILIVALDHDFSQSTQIDQPIASAATVTANQSSIPYKSSTITSHKLSSSTSHSTEAINLLNQDNLFINYISRIHREEDFEFILKGFTRLLNNPIQQSYLPNSNKRIQFHQELLVLFWKMCDYNKKFMYYVLKTCDVLKILVPILYHLNDARADRSRVGLVHIGVFIILLLSGERNFGVRLNRPYLATVPMDLPIFSGTHADLLVIVFHKLITTGHQRLQPLFDCLLTILVNVSPYLKTLSMVASAKILHLLEAFSTQWFLFSNPTNHHLVFFLLEIFNNIIQYQFDGNSNLIYTIIRKRSIFHSLANLPSDYGSIQRSLNQIKSGVPSSSASSCSGSSSLRRSGSKSARPKQRPISLMEESRTSSSHKYHHSQVMMTKSNPTSPQSSTSQFVNFDSVITPTDLSSINIDQPSPTTIESTSSATTPAIAKYLLEDEFPSTSSGVSSNAPPPPPPPPPPPRPPPPSHPPPIPPRRTSESTNMNVSLAAIPKLDSMTERTRPSLKSLSSTPSIEEADYNEFQTNTTPINDVIKRDSIGRSSSLTANTSSSTASATASNVQNRQSISRQSSTGSERTTANSVSRVNNLPWSPTSEWIVSWKQKLPLQTIMRMLQVQLIIKLQFSLISIYNLTRF